MPRNSRLGTAAKPNQFAEMRRILLELIAAVALTLAAILASVTSVIAGEIMVTEAFARASASPTAATGAAYVSVMNHGAEADRLIAVESPFGMAMLHRSVQENGVAKMEMLDAAEIPAMGTLEMKPGGLHIMLTGLKAPLKKGETMTLTLTFEKAGKLDVTVPVGGVAEMGHDHAGGTSSGG